MKKDRMAKVFRYYLKFIDRFKFMTTYQFIKLDSLSFQNSWGKCGNRKCNLLLYEKLEDTFLIYNFIKCVKNMNL